MKNFFFLIAFLLGIQPGSLAQKVVPSLPPSFSLNKKAFHPLPIHHFNIPDTSLLLEQDKEFPLPLRYGICRELSLNLVKEGVREELENGGTIWRYLLISDGAKGIGLRFSRYEVPPGAGLWLYDPSHTHCFGALTSENNNASGELMVSEQPGDSLILEYYEPAGVPFSGELQASYLVHAYREAYSIEPGTADGTLASNISTRCPVTKPYWDIKHAVCKITFNDETYAYLCTGFLVNNTANDGTPYFITANHCISSFKMLSTFVAYFNYEIEGCNVSGVEPKSLSGAQFLYTEKESDFTLLKLTDQPGPEYQPVYAGWDISDSAYYPGYVIHHPQGGPKYLSISKLQIKSYPSNIYWDNMTTTPPDSHWEVKITTGKTVGGSSGGPLFDKNSRVLGQLHGGDDTYDYYGKMSYSFNLNQGMFRKYLDPLNTLAKTLDAYVPETNYPESFFTANVNPACLGAPVVLQNQSMFDPGIYKWNISYNGMPTGYVYLYQTGSGAKNPVVRFTNTGLYTITLTTGKDTELTNTTTRSAVINVGKEINAELTDFPSTSSICGWDLKDYEITASGTPDYAWSFGENSDRVDIQQDSNKIRLNLSPWVEPMGSFTLPVQVIASHGSCADTLKRQLLVKLASNNEPEYAIPLEYGKNGDFTNSCATSFPEEPFPPATDCYGQKSWCEESVAGNNPLQNSVWFRLTGPPSGKLNIILQGFDAQMALYQADNAADFRDNPGSVLLIAANDNHGSGLEPEIESVEVVPGREYWLQVDGGNLGAEHSFNITVLTDEIKLFPNPTNGPFVLDVGKRASEDARVDIYDPQGRMLRRISIGPLGGGEKIPVDISWFPRGIYFLRFSSSLESSLTKILKL
ncbi:MAG: trypsin-like peptidase domain-containing protein [Bacteroidales bacterium]